MICPWHKVEMSIPYLGKRGETIAHRCPMCLAEACENLRTAKANNPRTRKKQKQRDE